MKTVKFIFATLGLVIIMNACAPVEEVTPQDSKIKLEKFDVKNDGEEGGLGVPGGKG